MKNIILISGTYIAALIGAGLASGAETSAFFARYGKYGFFGIIICAIIFSVFLYTVITGCNRLGVKSINEYMSKIGGKKIALLCESGIMLFMMCVYSTMIAGAGELAYDITNISPVTAMLIFNALCILIVTMPINRIMQLFGMLGLVLGTIIVFFAIRIAFNRGIEAFNIIDNWAVSAISYSGYNILSCVCILCPLATFIKTKRDAAAASILSGIIISAVLLCMWVAISIYYGKINLGTFPMLTLAMRQGELYYIIYIVVLFAAILTTAVSAAYGMYTSFYNMSGKIQAIIIIFIISSLLSYAGFEKLVNTVYRICGISGIILPIFIIRNEVKSQKTTK